ncbi:MAG: type II toxin-antitoxin system VapB family antitoxin [Anaerolineae bacterium]|nr:type II toxin-antitoxin system VapB family antitoxin [Anaerolineae bacterium]
MRTTIRINDQLLVEVKQLAAQTGQTLTAIIEESLRQMLARQKQLTERPPIQLITVSGNGPLPGIDLDDSATLLDLMD